MFAVPYGVFVVFPFLGGSIATLEEVKNIRSVWSELRYRI